LCIIAMHAVGVGWDTSALAVYTIMPRAATRVRCCAARARGKGRQAAAGMPTSCAPETERAARRT
jgi:hypothetical protein